MATKPQRRRRRSKEQRKQDGREMANAVTVLVDARIARLKRRHLAALWVAVVVGTVMGVVL